MSMNAALNVFLALLENRPESAREQFGKLPYRVTAAELATIDGRIRQAVENIKCQAIRDAVREVFNRTLRLYRAPTPAEEMSGCVAQQEEAFLEGVQAVEDVLAQALKTCEETQKKLGPG